jgi:hypothetical protein
MTESTDATDGMTSESMPPMVIAGRAWTLMNEGSRRWTSVTSLKWWI